MKGKKAIFKFKNVTEEAVDQHEQAQQWNSLVHVLAFLKYVRG